MMIGDVFTITEGDISTEYELVEMRKSGKIAMRERTDHGDREIRTFSKGAFRILQEGGGVLKHSVLQVSSRLAAAAMLDPASEARAREMSWLEESKTLHFFLERRHADGHWGWSDPQLDRLIAVYDSEASAHGLVWEPVNERKGIKRKWPSGSALRRASYLNEDRNPSIREIYDRRGRHSTANRWDPIILHARDAVIERYWNSRVITPRFAKALFFRIVLREKRRYLTVYAIELNVPCETTFGRWLHESTTRERVSKKYGEPVARRLFDGHGLGMVATRPLEIVQIDHTWTDAMLVIRNSAGKIIARRRAYYIGVVDVYSRAILAASLSFDPPSLASLAAAVKQAMRPKEFLREICPEYAEWAVDIYGYFLEAVLDNGMEAMRGSFELSCNMIGTNMNIAPIACPPYKAIVERSIDAANRGFWHLAPGAVPFKPGIMKEMGLNPTLAAEWTKEHANRELWRFITTQYHADIKGPIKMPSALKWQDGILEHGRPASDFDLHFVDCAFGQKKLDVTLTNLGVRVNNHAFGDGEAVSRLLSDLLVDGKPSFRRGKAPTRGKTKVDLVWYSDNCSFVSVYNKRRGNYVKLFNRDPMYRDNPVSWAVAEGIESYFQERNLKWESLEERYSRVADYAESLETVVERNTKTAKQDARKLHNLMQSTLLGGPIEQAYADPTPNGMAAPDGSIQVVMPGRELAGEVQVSRRPRVGGKAATRKGMETRRRNLKIDADPSDVSHVRPQAPQAQPPSRSDVIGDVGAFMATILGDLD